jgi:hypothetical protein
MWADDTIKMALKTPRWNHGLSHVSHVGHASPGDHHGIARRLDAWSASGLCCVWGEEPSECMIIQGEWMSREMTQLDRRQLTQQFTAAERDKVSIVRGERAPGVQQGVNRFAGADEIRGLFTNINHDGLS